MTCTTIFASEEIIRKAKSPCIFCGLPLGTTQSMIMLTEMYTTGLCLKCINIINSHKQPAVPTLH